MGLQEEHQSVAFGGKGEEQVKSMKEQTGELSASLVKLKEKCDNQKRNIVGITTEIDDVRKRIRFLLNKQTTGQGPDYDDYKITRKISTTYEPIATSRSKAQASKLAAEKALKEERAQEEQSASTTVVSVTVKTEENVEEVTTESAAAEE